MQAFYKLTYDISCYYAFAAFFLSYGMDYDVNPLSCLVFFIACFGAIYAEKLRNYYQIVQIGAFVLPVIPFLLETNIWGKCILILPWIYMIITVLRERYDMSYGQFKRTYLVIFWIYAAVFGCFIAEDFIKGEVAILVAGPFLLLLLVAGIFLLQLLRFQSGSADKKKLEKHQRKQLVAFMATVIVVTAGNVVELLYMYIFYPFTKLVFGAGLALIVYIIGALDRPPEVPKEIAPKTNDLAEFIKQKEEIRENMETIWGSLPERIRAEQSKEMDYTTVFIILAVVAAIVILAVLLGSKRSTRKQADIEDEREEYYDDVPLETVLRKRFVRPEIMIRYYYREFMKKSENKKHKLEASDTTEEILAKYRTWNDVTPQQTAEADEVTALYQKTRYSKEKITHTDANRMKALVKRL